MKTVKLNNSIEMPILGFGVYQIEDQSECERAVLDAFEVGYRLIDTASAYRNEIAVGNAIKASSVKREDMFITTKLWIKDAGYENTLKAFDTSLKKLQLDYLDLYLIHQPFNDVYGSWRAMERLYKEGRIKAIGVSNFQLDRLTDLMVYNEVPPAVNQIEINPFHQRYPDVEYMVTQGIQAEAWAPFAEGKNELFSNELLVALSVKYQKTVAQVVLRSLIQRNIVVIPKSSNRARIAENFDVFDFDISEQDLELVKQLDTNESVFFSHRDPEIVKWMSGFVRG
ncbi:aldo/keto reductase [uncultured Tolumonas sp.]|uniref:aldo/keto reductase n=1 Tax=uncultured Tolumonas sp. TaxID=263765 RepID=UPI00292EA0B7|nr:aldo/keto reductase [uncultured Tolumonas sp.]